ncbi:MAG TPA: DUF4468 domain-containing protein [Chitinophagales bacterium]|nr:DUF4468 domain-containing protein [Chitinophagales bacterium]
MSNSIRLFGKFAGSRRSFPGTPNRNFLRKGFLITTLLITCSVWAHAQKDKDKLLPPDMPRSEENSQVYYMEVVTEEGADKIELFKRAGNWFHKFYKNPTGIVEQMDSTNGKLVLKPAFPVYRMKNNVKVQAGIVKYTLEIGFKDGKYRYEIKNINIQAPSYFPIEKLFNANDPNIADNYNTLDEANKYFNDLLEDLIAGMRLPSKAVKKDEW